MVGNESFFSDFSLSYFTLDRTDLTIYQFSTADLICLRSHLIDEEMETQFLHKELAVNIKTVCVLNCGLTVTET